MYYKVPHENWFQKGLRFADQGVKIIGTAKGIYDAGAAVAAGLRGAYQAAAPMMALLRGISKCGNDRYRMRGTTAKGQWDTCGIMQSSGRGRSTTPWE